METTIAVACLAFEVTLAGFIGSTDATDDRVLWVTAPSADDLAAATEGLDCTVVPLDVVPQTDIDFQLPRDRDALRVRIRQFMAGPERPDRDCDPGCTRRLVPAAECDCSRSVASSTDPQAAEIQRRIEGFPEHALVPHSAEPWQGMLESGEPNRSVILSGRRDGRWLMSILHNGELTPAQQEADIRRIVACVNACTGIATDVLESIRGGFVDAAGEIKLLRLAAAPQAESAPAQQGAS